MNPAPSSTTRIRIPLWVRGTRALEVVTEATIGIAVLVEIAIALREGHPEGVVSAAVMAAATIAGSCRHLYAGLVLAAAGPLVATLLGWPPIHNWSIACFVVFLLALRGLPGLLAGVVLGSANLAAVGWSGGSLSPEANPAASIAAAAALMLAASGSAIRGQRLYFEALQQQTLEAVTTRQAVAERSVAQERVRIARDLHDSIGHQIAVVSMHLGAAEVHLDTDTAAAGTDLQAARAGIQSVLRETQDILQVLRVGAERNGLAPTPDHTRVADLVDAFRSAGVVVDAQLSGLDHPLPTSTSTAVLRIAQEALTNAERHGEGPVRLRVDLDDDIVSVEATNRRRADGRDTSGGGNGLVGMRERAESAGGHLTIHHDGRNFSVLAQLPATEEEAP